jgi:hypothetical protein
MDNLVTNKKGSNCSKSGKEYEKKVYNTINNCTINNQQFITQSINDLGGCSANHDLICTYNNIEIPVEIKKSNTPDWMQCSLKYDDINKKWNGTFNGKIPENSRKIFNALLNDIQLFNGKIPPFITDKITHSDWLKIKKEQDFKDQYIQCSSDTIKNLYKEKGCKYIQISEKGLYHLGDDICEFNVPEFLCEQQIRIRTKIHSKKNKNGFCDLSVTCACQPKNIKKLQNSDYS